MVCERASLTEKLATMRTKQMSMDLDAHSKQQVNFFHMFEKVNLFNYSEFVQFSSSKN